MGFVEQLRAERVRPVAVFLQFEMYYGTGRCGIIAFVESYDDKEFLCHELARRLKPGLGLEFIICDGKDGVLAALGDVEARRPDARGALFFVDKDFDDYIPMSRPKSRRLFTTSVYSIENYVATDETLRFILVHCAHLSDGDSRVEKVLKAYEASITRAARIARRYMAWLICARRNGVKVNINNINLHRVVNFDPDLGFSLADGADEVMLQMLRIRVNPIDSEALRVQMRLLSSRDYKKWLRGKLELWMFLRFVAWFWSVREKERDAGGRRIRRPLDLTSHNAFQFLAGRVSYPRDLHAFLDSALAN